LLLPAVPQCRQEGRVGPPSGRLPAGITPERDPYGEKSPAQPFCNRIRPSLRCPPCKVPVTSNTASSTWWAAPGGNGNGGVRRRGTDSSGGTHEDEGVMQVRRPGTVAVGRSNPGEADRDGPAHPALPRSGGTVVGRLGEPPGPPFFVSRAGPFSRSPFHGRVKGGGGLPSPRERTFGPSLRAQPAD
jgi:hypothetical protein